MSQDRIYLQTAGAHVRIGRTHPSQSLMAARELEVSHECQRRYHTDGVLKVLRQDVCHPLECSKTGPL